MSAPASSDPRRTPWRRACVWLLLSLCCAAGSAWPGGAHAERVIRFSHVVARDTPKGLAVERFKELVESGYGLCDSETAYAANQPNLAI